MAKASAKTAGAQAAPAVEPGAPVPALSVVSRQAAGSWRAGRHFTAAPTLLPLHETTAEDAAAIRACGLLLVQDVEIPA